MTGLSFYKTHDKGVKINAGDDEYREHLDPDRWRFALQQMWSHRVNLRTDWRLKANINMLSDEYMLRDFIRKFISAILLRTTRCFFPVRTIRMIFTVAAFCPQ